MLSSMVWQLGIDLCEFIQDPTLVQSLSNAIVFCRVGKSHKRVSEGGCFVEVSGEAVVGKRTRGRVVGLRRARRGGDRGSRRSGRDEVSMNPPVGISWKVDRERYLTLNRVAEGETRPSRDWRGLKFGQI